jgi:steroid delta-isomerase-like uncharacterized protein
MNSENAKIIVQRLIYAINKRDFFAMEELIYEDFLEELPFPDQVPGRKGLLNTIQKFYDAFPDLQCKIEEQVSEESKVLTRFRIEGTHLNDLWIYPATGKKVSVLAMALDVVINNQITKSLILIDNIQLMK